MIFQANGIQKNAGVVVQISDEIDFGIKKGKERYWGTLHKDKGNDAPRRHNTY